MDRTRGILVVILLLAVAILFAYVRQHKERGVTNSVATTSEQVTPTDTPSLPPGYDPQDEERWMNDYNFRADSHKLIATGKDHSYFCKINERYEGPTSCYLFLEKGGTYTPTGLLAQDVDTTLLVSSDSNYILVIEPQKATLIRVADDQRRVLYSVGDTEVLGYYGNSDFRARARWIGNNVVEIQVFSIEKSVDDSSPIRTESLSI